MKELKDGPQEPGAKNSRWLFWLAPVLLLSSLSLCALNYLDYSWLPLYWLAISSNRLIFVAIFSVIIIFLITRNIPKIPQNFSSRLRNMMIGLYSLTLLFICTNLFITFLVGTFAGFYELDRVDFNGQRYRLVLDEDFDVYYTYGLCQCQGFGERCLCDHFYATKWPHDRTFPSLEVDLTTNILQIKFDEEIWYEYNGETAKCYELIQLNGTCLNN